MSSTRRRSVDHGDDTVAVLLLVSAWCLRWWSPVSKDLHEHGWWLVELGAVELVETVLGELKQLLGGVVVHHERLVDGILLAALIDRFGNRLVERNNALVQGGDPWGF